MKELEWFFPEDLAQVPALMSMKGIVPHGGGTGILKSGTGRINGLIDLSRLPLGYFRAGKSRIEFGASQTYSELIKNIRRIDTGHILVKALGGSANTPLRNRITAGGSIALYPPWSDLMGPLIALGADVSLIGKNNNNVNISEYSSNRDLVKGNLITGVSFEDKSWLSYYYRESRTSVDYPAFTVTILLNKLDDAIDDPSIVISGCTGRFKKLDGLEKYLKGKSAGEIDVAGAVDLVNVSFPRKKNMTPEYLKHLAGVQVERGLESLLKGRGKW
jgi:CO/xanthine dehydrogenase FAD-binding subunit